MKQYEQLVEDLTRLIDSGVLQPGARMPSVRKLTRSHAVSPGTVLQAYGVLEDRGVIEARPRSGYYVAVRRSAALPTPAAYRPDGYSTPVDVSELVFQVLESTRDRAVVPLGSAFPSPLLFPFKHLFRGLSSVSRDFDPFQTVKDLSPGNLELRRLIARRYLDAGCAIDAEEIVITSGAMEALNICLQATTRPGEVVAIETPTFPPALQAIEAAGLRAVEIPTDPQRGVDLNALEQALARHAIKACWFMTNFQNPLGSRMADDDKKALVDLLTRHDVPLIEDDVYAELYLKGARPKPAKAFDTAGLVMHCSSFSKNLAPGFRVGWVAPGRYARQVAQRKLISSLSASVPAQLAIAHYLKQGSYERHLRRLRHALLTQQQCMLHAVGRYFPESCRVTQPDGGYFIWVELPDAVDALTLHEKAMSAGVSISPGPMFSAQRGFRNCLRLNYGHPWSEEMDGAIRKLGSMVTRTAR
jgi:DNA-binding transcriptional MocR family regulator